MGDRITEADWRLFTTRIRFDPVYHSHFKCNLRRLVDYLNLWGFTRELSQWPGVAATVNMRHIKEHYYRSHPTINPNDSVPAGPVLDLDLDLAQPHGRIVPSNSNRIWQEASYQEIAVCAVCYR